MTSLTTCLKYLFFSFTIFLNPGNTNIIKLIDDGELIMIGQPAPEFNLPDLEGTQVKLSSYKDNFVVIHIATTWCPFCNAEAPYLEELSQQYKDRNVKVLIIDVKEPKELVKSI
ncbi:MAG: redoxin domain-containing protein [Cyclobacteriaceae bacterium]|nr:redoxin domain-containing protein [Cyclobacteriaceae bacterium]